MDDLELVVVLAALDPAADDAARPRGMGPLQVRAVSGEPDQGDEAGVVERADLPGAAQPAGPLVRVDGDDEGLVLALRGARGLDDLPAHQALGREEEHVAHPRPGHSLQERGDARADALERGDRREQRKENLRPHASATIAPRLHRRDDEPWTLYGSPARSNSRRSFP